MVGRINENSHASAKPFAGMWEGELRGCDTAGQTVGPRQHQETPQSIQHTFSILVGKLNSYRCATCSVERSCPRGSSIWGRGTSNFGIRLLSPAA